MAVCSEVVPPEVTFDGVRVACHLYTAGGDGTPVTTAPPNSLAAQAAEAAPAASGSGPRRERPVTDELLRLTGLKVHFPIRGGFLDTVRGTHRGVIRAVDGIDLVLGRGEVLALVGESGSGKTTTGRVVVKLTRQTAGSIVFDGSRRQRGLGIEGPWRLSAARPDHLPGPVRDAEPEADRSSTSWRSRWSSMASGRARSARRRSFAALESAGLRPASEFAVRFPHELSGGQRQRVVIAGALVMDPEV